MHLFSLYRNHNHCWFLLEISSSYYVYNNLSLVMRKPFFTCAKTKTQISCAVTAQLITAFVFATWIVQPHFYLNQKFHASSHLRWLYSQDCVGPGRKARRSFFSERGSFNATYNLHIWNQTTVISPEWWTKRTIFHTNSPPIHSGVRLSVLRKPGLLYHPE